MKSPDSPEYYQVRLSEDLLLKLNAQRANILGPVRALLQSGTVEDENDQKIIEEVSAFIENPSEDIEEMKGHTTNIGMVMAGYEMQGADVPQEIDNLHHYLLTLQCLNRMKFIEGIVYDELIAVPNLMETGRKIDLALAQATDWASILSVGYKNDTLIYAVNVFLAKIKEMFHPEKNDPNDSKLN